MDSQRAGRAALREGFCFGRNKALELSHLAEQRDKVPSLVRMETSGLGGKLGHSRGLETGGLDLAASLTCGWAEGIRKGTAGGWGGLLSLPASCCQDETNLSSSLAREGEPGTVHLFPSTSEAGGWKASKLSKAQCM